jgi:hypothetical protein
LIISIKPKSEYFEELSIAFSNVPNINISKKMLTVSTTNRLDTVVKTLVRRHIKKIYEYKFDMILQTAKSGPSYVKVPDDLKQYLQPLKVVNEKAEIPTTVKPIKTDKKVETTPKIETKSTTTKTQTKRTKRTKQSTIIEPNTKKNKPTSVIPQSGETSIVERPNKRANLEPDISKMVDVLVNLFRLNGIDIPDNSADARDYLVKEAVIALSNDLTPKLIKRMSKSSSITL